MRHDPVASFKRRTPSSFPSSRAISAYSTLGLLGCTARAIRPTLAAGNPVPAVDHAVPFVDVTTRLFMTAAKKRVTPAARATTTEQWTPVRRRTHLNPPPGAAMRS